MPGGADKFEQRLLNCVATLQQESPNIASPPPQHPPQAHLQGNRRATQPHAVSDEVNIPPQQDTQRSDDASSLDCESAVPGQGSPLSGEAQYLLLCVNTRNSTVLVHVEVGALTNDEYLFRDIHQAYRTARENHEWRFSMMVPLWTRNLAHQFSKCLPSLPLLPASMNFLPMLSRTFHSAHVHKIASGDFVRVRAQTLNNQDTMQTYISCSFS